MNSAFLYLTAYAINAVWQIPLLGAVGWGLSRLVKPTGPELQHKIWVAVLMLATVTPATPVFQRYLTHNPPAGIVNVPPSPIFAPARDRPVPVAGAQLVLPPIAIYLVCALYIAALLFLTLKLCWMIRCTATLLRNAEPAPIGPDYLAIWERSRERFFVLAASLRYSHHIPGPVTAGFRLPVLLLPAEFLAEHSPTEFLAVAGHECAHIRRNDFRKNLLYEAAALLTAFHPVTWFIKSQIAQTREMICDRMAAEGLLDRRSYGQSLLQLAAKMPATAPSLGFHTMAMFDRNVLERRVMTLMTSLPRVSRIHRYLLGVTAILLLLLCAGVSGWFTHSVAAQTSNPSTQSDSADKKEQKARPDLDCTYYDKGVPSPGTCGFDPEDKTKYRCYLNADPAKSQPQLSCESKVLRATGAKK